jgi:hypothetical protein
MLVINKIDCELSSISYINNNNENKLIAEYKNYEIVFSVNNNGDIYYSPIFGVDNGELTIDRDSTRFQYKRFNIFDSLKDKEITIDLDYLYKTFNTNKAWIIPDNDIIYLKMNDLIIGYDIDTQIITKSNIDDVCRLKKQISVYLDAFLTRESKRNNKILRHQKRDIRFLYQ